MPGIWPGRRENSGYLLIGNERGALWFQEGRRGAVLGGVVRNLEVNYADGLYLHFYFPKWRSAKSKYCSQSYSARSWPPLRMW